MNTTTGQTVNGWLTDLGSLLGTASNINQQLSAGNQNQQIAQPAQTLNSQQGITGTQIAIGAGLLILGALLIKAIL